MPQKTDTPRTDAASGGIIDNLKVGLKVLGAELKWTVLRVTRGYEIKQMRRRLDEEYALLGKLARTRMAAEGGKATLPRDGEAGIILSQIEFLEKEIEFMEAGIERSREDSLARRKDELGLNDEN